MEMFARVVVACLVAFSVAEVTSPETIDSEGLADVRAAAFWTCWFPAPCCAGTVCVPNTCTLRAGGCQVGGGGTGCVAPGATVGTCGPSSNPFASCPPFTCPATASPGGCTAACTPNPCGAPAGGAAGC
jgi:hypothetical protein